METLEILAGNLSVPSIRNTADNSKPTKHAAKVSQEPPIG